MKVLFISSRDVTVKTNGGFQCTNRNYLSFCELFGDDEVEVIDLSLELNESFRSRFVKWSNYLRGFWPGVSRKLINKIIENAKVAEYIFIDSSNLGVLAYYLRRAKYQGQIISFFHNVEYCIQLEKLKLNPFNFWRAMLIKYNEKKALQYSDKVVTLNNRDKDELQRVYKIKNINYHLIPISFIDELKEEQIQKTEIIAKPAKYVFIGNYWYPNIHGIKWFIKNVLPYTEIKLQIVGIRMEAFKNQYQHNRIEYLGYVKDLTPIIIAADYMISPIFKGSGMKVKTCEALMYGKNIIGTKEAFEGYEIDYNKIGAICETKEDFIKTIHAFSEASKLKFNHYSRQHFLKSYSFNATLKKFEELIQN